MLDFFKKQKVKPYDRQAVVGVLPFDLKSKILRHLYASAIQSVPLLKGMSDDDIFLTDVCIRLQPYSCSAQTFVYQRGEHGCRASNQHGWAVIGLLCVDECFTIV